MIPLYGAAGLLAQCKALGGAAGTLSVYFTNFDGAIGLLDAKGYPPQDTATTASIAANGIGSASAQTYANKCWIVFTPSASGTIYIAVNVRRIAA
jgi:hypothetical protein